MLESEAGTLAEREDITRLPMYQRARMGLGYLAQEASIFRGMTVEQNIRAVLEPHDDNGLVDGPKLRVGRVGHGAARRGDLDDLADQPAREVEVVNAHVDEEAP
mgnify:CR=1 FL=1